MKLSQLVNNVVSLKRTTRRTSSRSTQTLQTPFLLCSACQSLLSVSAVMNVRLFVHVNRWKFRCEQGRLYESALQEEEEENVTERSHRLNSNISKDTPVFREVVARCFGSHEWSHAPPLRFVEVTCLTDGHFTQTIAEICSRFQTVRCGIEYRQKAKPMNNWWSTKCCVPLRIFITSCYVLDSALRN